MYICYFFLFFSVSLWTLLSAINVFHSFIGYHLHFIGLFSAADDRIYIIAFHFVSHFWRAFTMHMRELSWACLFGMQYCRLSHAGTAVPHPPWPRLISDVGLELEGTLINCSLL